jgi:hypothetical protein
VVIAMGKYNFPTQRPARRKYSIVISTLYFARGKWESVFHLYRLREGNTKLLKRLCKLQEGLNDQDFPPYKLHED